MKQGEITERASDCLRRGSYPESATEGGPRAARRGARRSHRRAQEYPFTRGIFRMVNNGRMGRSASIRLRHRRGVERALVLLAQARLAVGQLDLPTQCGYDPTHPMARSEIGKVASAVQPERSGDLQGSTSRRSRPRSRSTARRRSSTRCTSPSPTSKAFRAPSSRGRSTSSRATARFSTTPGRFRHRAHRRSTSPRFPSSRRSLRPISRASACSFTPRLRAVRPRTTSRSTTFKSRPSTTRRRGGNVEKFAKRLSLLLCPHGFLRRDRRFARVGEGRSS